MTEAPDWLWMDLRCYSCNADLVLQPGLDTNKAKVYCSMACSRTPALTVEIVAAFKRLLDTRGVRWYLDKVGAMAVADALLDPALPNHRTDTATAVDGLRSWQVRLRRIEEIGSWIRIPLEVAA